MKNRLKTMQTIIELHNFFIDAWNSSHEFQIKKEPILQKDWLSAKFDRFYLVESTRHEEENFMVQVCLRYALRSAEAKKYGTGHMYFHDRFIGTAHFDLDDIENPEGFKKRILKEFTETLSNTNS